MNLEELKVLATQIIEAGHADDKTEDDIKMDMFGAKIPFSKLNSLYKTIAIELGLLVDPKVVTEGVSELVEMVSWDDMETWDDVQGAVDSIADKVDGATPQRVISLIRAHCREEEIELPKKPKGTAGGGGRARGGKAAAAMVELFAANPAPTKQEFYDVVRPVTKGHRNVMDYMNMYFYILSAVKGGEGDLTKIIEALRGTEDPKNLDTPEEAPEVAEFDEEDEVA